MTRESKLLSHFASMLLVALALTAPAAGQGVKVPKQTKALPSAATAVKAPPQAAAPDSMMAAMMKLAAPGPQHEALEVMEGTWKATVKAYGPTGEPTTSDGVSENRMILGGRYLEQRFKSTMMNQPFEGRGLTGYDNGAQHYTFAWVDNMSTVIMTGSGTMDDASKTLTVSATTPGPDGKPTEVRMVTKIVDANSHVFSMYGTMGGKEQLMMEITYTRQ
jgi:hypothetical protein